MSSTAAWHVVLVVENIPFGADHRLRKQADTLLRHGCRVTVISPRDDVNRPHRRRRGLRILEYAAAPEPGGPVGHAVEYAWAGIRATLLLLRVRLRGRVDVVQLCQPPDIYFPIARLLRVAGSRVVVDQRDLMPELLVARYPAAPRRAIGFLHLLERRTQRAVDHTITVNEHLRARLQGAGGHPDDVSVVWNGPVLARVDAVRASPRSSDAEGHLVVWVGKMGVQDRVELVVEVADRVVHGRGRDDIRFVLVGDGECLDDLRALVHGRSLDEHVGFTGWVPEETVFGHLAVADLGIDTSLQEEVTPVKAIEYMSFGLTFVAFDLPETRRLAEDAAVYVPPGDLDALADSVVGLIDEEPRRRELGTAGRRRVETTLSWESQEAAYLAAVGPSGRPPRDATEPESSPPGRTTA